MGSFGRLEEPRGVAERTAKPRVVEPSRCQGVMRFEMPEDVVASDHSGRVLDWVVGR